MNKARLIETLQNANFSNEEIEEITNKLDITQEAKEKIAIIEQLGVSAASFIEQIAKQLKENNWKYFWDIILISMFLITLLILAYNNLIKEESTGTVFALIIGYVLAKFKKGLNV